MIKIYKFEDFESEKFGDKIDDFPLCLKEKILKKGDEAKKKMCIFEYFQLQKLLKLQDLQNLNFTANGKPYIKNGKFFSLSNSDNIVCISISKNCVGVDVQKMIPYQPKLAQRICSKEEISALNKCQNKSKFLTKLWVMKESVIKCEGQTLAQDLRKIIKDDDKYKFSFRKFKNYYICKCEKRHKN